MPKLRLATGPQSPDIIKLYYVVPHDTLGEDIIKQMRTDFALAAHEQYYPLVRLEISRRSDFIGFTPEEVLKTLEEEAPHEKVVPFLLATQDTVNSSGGEVLYVERWASLDDFETENLVEHARATRTPESTDLKFSLKLRVTVYYAPVLWANLSIVNITIPEIIDQWPYDPDVTQPPPADNHDWRKDAPYPATVVASPTSFEVSTTESRVLILGGGEPPKSYRLTQAAADALGVVSEWVPGWHDEREADGTVTFSQPWRERVLILPD